MKGNISALIDKRSRLLKNTYVENEEKISSISLAISELEAKDNINLIIENFQTLSDNPEAINLQQVWKTLKKRWPKHENVLPTAKRNHSGKIVSGPTEIKKLMAKEYRERLRTRPIRPVLEFLNSSKKEIFEMKMKIAEAEESSPWDMNDLEAALSNLKNNKERDSKGYMNEIFKSDVSVIRYILMRVIYNSKYPDIDHNMSDYQMGGRKNK